MVERFPDELRPEDYLDRVIAEAPILLSRAELGV
jgi:hypothetical protein